MNALERLMSEFENDLTFKFMKNMPESLAGLIIDRTIYINANMPFEHAVIKLAEEIGHYQTADIDIVDQSKRINRKLETRGKQWGYKKLVPYEKLRKFIKSKESIHNYEIAEEFGIPGEVVEEVINMYRVEGKI